MYTPVMYHLLQCMVVRVVEGGMFAGRHLRVSGNLLILCWVSP